MTFAKRFWVSGLPKPKGSLRPVGRLGQKARLIEQVDPKGVWKTAIKAEALKHVDGEPYTGPVQARLSFYFPKPQKPRHAQPTTRTSGDVDKLQRNVFDALQTKSGAGLIQDDSQIVHVIAEKHYVNMNTPEPGIWITLTPYQPSVCSVCGSDQGIAGECNTCFLDWDERFA
jgi:Holliday junction resolvase RusA-like endonuclease